MNIFVRIVEKFWNPLFAMYRRSGERVVLTEPLAMGVTLDVELTSCDPVKLSQWLTDLVYLLDEDDCTVQIGYKQLDKASLNTSEVNRIVTTRSAKPLELFICVLPNEQREQLNFRIIVDRTTTKAIQMFILFDLEEVKERYLGHQLIEFLQATADAVGASTWYCGLEPATKAATQIYSHNGKGPLYHAMIRHEQKGYMSVSERGDSEN